MLILTLLLGTAFLFKYGLDNDWLDRRPRRIGIAAGIVALIAGDRIWRRGDHI
jgi:uncharacterized membrane protein